MSPYTFKTFVRIYAVAFLIGFAMLGLVSLIIVAASHALTLEWDRNIESDMRDYQVYMCFTPGCVVIKSSSQFQGTVAQPTLSVKPSYPVPVNSQGSVAVSARDLSLNESGLSVALPFDAIPPTVPLNPILK